MLHDHLVKAVTSDGNLRAASVLTSSTVQEALDRHNLYPVPTAALGRLLTGGLLLAADFKGKERINLRIDGDGPIGQVYVDAGFGEARGYASNPDIHLPLNSRGKLDVAGAVGKGTLYVVKDLGLKETWSSSVNLISGEIAEDLTYYLTHSEQIPSAMALGVVVTPEARVAISGGFPSPGDARMSRRSSGKGRGQGDPSKEHYSAPMDMQKPEFVVRWLLEGLAPQMFAPIPLSYECKCSKERMSRALVSLGKAELAELAADPDGFETVCHFCNEKYPFNQGEILEIVKRM